MEPELQSKMPQIPENRSALTREKELATSEKQVVVVLLLLLLLLRKIQRLLAVPKSISSLREDEVILCWLDSRVNGAEIKAILYALVCL